MIKGMGKSSGRGASGAGAAVADLDDAHVVAAYARWAPIYDATFGAYTRGPARIGVAEVNRLPPGRVLELGVGTGNSLPLYDRKHRIVGIDLSREMLARARKRVAEEKLDHVEGLHEMDAGNLAFPPASFDIAIAMFVITVVPDPDRVLAELARVVRPGGRVVLVNHFAVDRGPRAAIERWLARYSAKLGWHPDFPIERVLGQSDLKLLDRRSAKMLEIFTLLVFERV